MPTAIGEKVVEVQKLWKGLNLPDSFPTERAGTDRRRGARNSKSVTRMKMPAKAEGRISGSLAMGNPANA